MMRNICGGSRERKGYGEELRNINSKLTSQVNDSRDWDESKFEGERKTSEGAEEGRELHGFKPRVDGNVELQKVNRR